MNPLPGIEPQRPVEPPQRLGLPPEGGQSPKRPVVVVDAALQGRQQVVDPLSTVDPHRRGKRDRRRGEQGGGYQNRLPVPPGEPDEAPGPRLAVGRDRLVGQPPLDVVGQRPGARGSGPRAAAPSP